MLIQIASLYGLTLLACAVLVAGLEWAQLKAHGPLAAPLDWARAIAMGWLAAPLALPALLLLPFLRRRRPRNVSPA